MASTRVHPVEYDGVWRKIRIADGESLYGSVKCAFPELTNTAFGVRYFDDEVETWIDVRSTDKPPTKTKLQVVRGPSRPSSTASSSITERQSVNK